MNVAKSGINVVIAKCCSSSAQLAMGTFDSRILQDTKIFKGTTISRGPTSQQIV